MKLLIAFSCAIALASAQWSGHNAYHVPVIGPNGVPVETPEVQAARNYHLSALNEAASRAGPSTWNQGNTWDQGNSWNDGSQRGPDSRYYGPHAYQTTYGVAKVTADGVPLDNPEVAAAKANHFAAFSEALSRNVPTHGYGHYRKRRGIYGAYPAHVDYNFYGVGHDGRPLDTPAVAHAKAAHYAAFNEAAARNGVGHAGLIAAPWGYGGVAAIHNGVPVDTPEVQQAKAAHFAAHAAAAHRH